MAMKEEKHQLLEKLHEMETQLQEANETLTKYMHEHEVCNVGFSSIPLKMNALVFLKITQEE
jgi:hypothetical protein